MHFGKKTALLAAVASLGFVSAAQAALKLEVTNLANNAQVIVLDGGVGDGSAPNDSQIVYNGSGVWNAFDIAITVALSNAPGNAQAAIIQMQELRITSIVPVDNRQIRVRVIEDNFSLPGSIGDSLTLQSSIGGTFFNSVGSTVSFFSTATPNATATAPLNFVASPLPPGAIQESFNGTNSAPFLRTATPFTVTADLTYNIVPGGQVNVSGTTSVIPEPASASLLAVGGLALLRRRR